MILLKNTFEKYLSPLGRLREVLYIIFYLTFSSLYAQEVVWQKHYGNNGSEDLYDITKVGDYYYAGGSSKQDTLYPIDRAISLIKIDSTGDTLFIRYFDGNLKNSKTG